jgi:uncharacterized protein (DUF2384 family)
MAVVAESRVTIALGRPEVAERLIRETNDELAQHRTIPRHVAAAVRDLTDAVLTIPASDRALLDRDVAELLLEGALGARRALDLPDRREARRELRVRLEQLREVFGELAERLPVRDERPIEDVTRWLAATLGASPTRLAELLGVSPRTVQRWLADTNPVRPSGEHALRLRVLARVVNNLRHMFTPEGVIVWLTHPHPGLGRKPPASLLGEPDAIPRLLEAAGAARESVAT